MNAPAKPSGVLLMSNDMATPFAKTTDFIAAAIERRGVPAYVRDSTEGRNLTYLFQQEMASRSLEAQDAIADALRELCELAGIDTVLSLDLNWYLTPGLFVDDAAIRSVHSLWFDDFRSFCTSASNPLFPVDGDVFQRTIKHPKVTHHFYGDSMAQEARLLGFTSQRITRLAAPRQLIECDAPCTHRDKLVFIGNPGFRGTPHAGAIKLIERGADIDELRAFSRNATLKHPDVKLVEWIREEPEIVKLLGAALETRRQFPYRPALQILHEVRTHSPRAFDYANEKGVILDLAFLVKLVNRYDRPAFIHRLWKRGWIDVYSAASEWEPYGVEALPYVNFCDLPEYYRKYAVHLNAPNSIRDATANEKLFEIAACGRLSINLDSPDVRSCYGPGEIVLVDSLAALEAAAEQVLRDPEAALASGEKARKRTEKEHLWDHRVAAMLPGLGETTPR
ncbi:MAG TPA: glycosyltransferase [Candidatus Methylacidiphilales bacterium]|jgi:glycosyltransferase involved in cell wall biosynthesis|nr:glycosyltransferase [Candidatus Methylacidiphilales bacterium]